jgi:hypothetical protein
VVTLLRELDRNVAAAAPYLRRGRRGGLPIRTVRNLDAHLPRHDQASVIDSLQKGPLLPQYEPVTLRELKIAPAVFVLEQSGSIRLIVRQ